MELQVYDEAIMAAKRLEASTRHHDSNTENDYGDATAPTTASHKYTLLNAKITTWKFRHPRNWLATHSACTKTRNEMCTSRRLLNVVV